MESNIELKTCKKHGLTEFILRKDGRYRCKKCCIEAVQKRREKTKNLLIEYKGGECQICHYKKYRGALEFHHINPEEKDFSISKDGNTRSLEANVLEVQKCLLVCSNCHKEIHAGLVDISDIPIINNEEVLQKESIKDKVIIKKETKRPNKETLFNLIRSKSFVEIGRQFGVSDNSVRKWCKYYNLPFRKRDLI